MLTTATLRFQEFVDAGKFKVILNKQDPRIQHTMEVEKEGKILQFLEILTRNNGEGKYDFQVYRKKAITNVQVKPNSSHDPKVLRGIFKGFVHRAYKICSEQYLNEEVDFLINVFVENGYEESMLRTLAEEVRNRRTTAPPDVTPNQQDSESMQTITLPWIEGVSPRLKKVFRKAGYRVSFKLNPNLQSILTKKNKVRLPPNSQPGVYKIPCGCGKVPPYIGKTKLRIRKRVDQHKEYVENEDWKRSGAAQHARTCSVGPLFDKAETIKMIHGNFDRSVREALEIQRHRSAPKYGGINLDDGQYVKTTFWIPMMDWISKEEKEKADRRIRRYMTSNLTSNNPTSEDNAMLSDS